MSASLPRIEDRVRLSRSALERMVRDRTADLRNLSQRLLKLQDEERRRIARDLHDSVGQILTALKIDACIREKQIPPGSIRDRLAGIAELADQALQEIRTTSYLLHPPLLDEAGFFGAAKWYLEGFAQRSGLTIRVDFEPIAERLPNLVERALFRILQEGLTNVHRHSGSAEVEVCFRQEPLRAALEIRDYGCGMPSSRKRADALRAGVGLAGMRERMSELKGVLEILPAVPGTRLRAIIPFHPSPA